MTAATTPDLSRLARELLDAHDALLATRNTEPWLPDDEEAMRRHPNASAWLYWREQVSKPAYERWSTAIDAFNAATGATSRHPINFRPHAESILAGGAS